jgi:hypothetical protein
LLSALVAGFVVGIAVADRLLRYADARRNRNADRPARCNLHRRRQPFVLLVLLSSLVLLVDRVVVVFLRHVCLRRLENQSHWLLPLSPIGNGAYVFLLLVVRFAIRFRSLFRHLRVDGTSRVAAQRPPPAMTAPRLRPLRRSRRPTT